MLALYFGTWTYWEDYNPPNYFGNHKVVFDGTNKLIIVSSGVTELDFKTDVYKAWKEWVTDPNQENGKYSVAISAVGGDPLPGSRALGTTYFLENGWRMRTWEGDHTLTITGNFFTREGVSPFVPTILSWTTSINLTTSSIVETVFGQTSITPSDQSAIASAVWTDEVATSLLNDISSIPASVWDQILDSTKNESAKDKLKKIATKSQTIALS